MLLTMPLARLKSLSAQQSSMIDILSNDRTILVSSLQEAILPREAQKRVERAGRVRQWLRTVPLAWRRELYSNLGLDPDLPVQKSLYDAHLVMHIERVSL